MHFHLAGAFEALVFHAYAFVPVPGRAPLPSLGDQQAIAVRDYLVQHGVAPERVVDRLLADGALRPVSAHAVPAKPYRALVSQRQRQRLAVRLFLDWLHEHCRPKPGSTAG